MFQGYGYSDADHVQTEKGESADCWCNYNSKVNISFACWGVFPEYFWYQYTPDFISKNKTAAVF